MRDKASGEVVCTLTSTTFCRADGGFGGPAGPVKAPHPIPDAPPQHVCDLPTLPQAALIYRLSGDYNPLHADPAYAAKAGFKMPILHGRCTFSIAGHAILKTLLRLRPRALRSHGGALFLAGVSGRDDTHGDVARRQRRLVPLHRAALAA